MIDTSLFLFVGLFVLFFSRLLCPWKLCGAWLEFANYCSLLYVLLGVLYIISFVSFINSAVDRHVCQLPGAVLQPWLNPLMWPVPFVALLTIACCASQTFTHVTEIKKGAAPVKHDRAVQILVLPAVYAVMAMGALARVFHLTVSDITDQELWEKQQKNVLSKAETCYTVAELYEAWALYQFAKLALEVLQEVFARQEASDQEEQRAAARSLLIAHKAVDSLTWIGTWMFFIVCILHTGWSLWLLCFDTAETKWETYEKHMLAFTAAGTVASGTAIFNIATVERTFGHQLEFFSPLLKFLSVKILVSFAFFQHAIFSALAAMYQTVPAGAQGVFTAIPMIGTLMTLSKVQMQLLYASLIIYESLIVSCLHWWAWSAKEQWYLSVPTDKIYGTFAAKETGH